MQDHSNVRWDLLVQEMARKTSKNFIAKELGVNAKEVNRWICDPATSKPRVPHHSNKDAILRLAEKLEVRWRSFSELMPVFDFGRSFQANRLRGPQSLSRAPKDIPLVPITFLGYQLNSPVGLAASPLTADSTWVGVFAERGFDVLTYNTVRSSNTVAHAIPNILFIHSLSAPISSQDLGAVVYASSDPPEGDLCSISLTTSYGVPSSEPSEWKKDVSAALGKLTAGQILIVSVLGTESQERTLEEDFLLCATTAAAAGAHAVELNFGCRIVFKDQRSSLSHDCQLSRAIVEKVRLALPNVKLLIKLDFLQSPELDQLFESTHEFVDGYTALTPVPMQVMTHGQAGDEAVFSSQSRSNPGVSGAAIRNLTLNMIRQLNKLRSRKQSLAIVAAGGISTAEHAKEFLDAGADVVQMATAAIFNPSVAVEVRSGLAFQKVTSARNSTSDTFDGLHFSDDSVRQAYQLTAEVCRDLDVDFDIGLVALYKNWLIPHMNDVAWLGQSGDNGIRTRRSIPQKHQLRDWIFRAQKSRK